MALAFLPPDTDWEEGEQQRMAIQPYIVRLQILGRPCQIPCVLNTLQMKNQYSLLPLVQSIIPLTTAYNHTQLRGFCQ